MNVMEKGRLLWSVKIAMAMVTSNAQIVTETAG